jgi:hypothetical protein
MSIEFNAIHNVVRTYQRMLHADALPPSKAERAGGGRPDRVTISREARMLQEASAGPVAEPGAGEAGRASDGPPV